MIEFDGYITGPALKRFHRNNKVTGIKFIMASVLLVAPFVIGFAIKSQNWLLVILSCVMICIAPLSVFLPQSKKYNQSITPKNIVIDDGYITCKTEIQGETRLISDVKWVYEHDEFYEFIFPFGKISTSFICQKSLLCKGSLEEFEALFKDKLLPAEEK